MIIVAFWCFWFIYLLKLKYKSWDYFSFLGFMFKFKGISLSHPVGLHILGEFVQNMAMIVIGDMFNSILLDGAQPKIIALAVSLENIHCYIGFTNLGYEGSVGSIPNIHCSVLAGLVADYGFDPFEGMHVGLEDSNNFEFIEVGYPVEGGV